VLSSLQGWTPPSNVYVGWSHHNYFETRFISPSSEKRMRNVIDAMATYQWKGSGGDRYIWLTEGSDMIPSHEPASVQAASAQKIADCFARAQSATPY
jgi:hypothetical protein